MLGSVNLGLGSVPLAGDNPSGGTGVGDVDSVTATAPAVIDNTDPANPVVQVAATAPGAVGPASAGTSNDLARGNHSHAILTVADAAAMSALVVTAIPDGTPVHVASRDAVFRLATSARTTNTWDTFASATAGRQWLREVHVSLKNAAQTAWGVNTTTGSDDAVGGVATPLRTMSELSWRLSMTPLSAAVSVQVTGSMVATDLPVFSFRCQPAATFTVTCVPTVVYTGAIGVATAAAAGPGTGDNNITDPAVPGGSFTAGGALAAGVIGTRTNGTAAYFWFALDKGATTARISKPSAPLANGDTYTVSTLPTLQVMRFAEQRYNAVVIQLARIASGPWTDSSLRFDRCWLTSAAQLPAVAYANCAFEGAVNWTQGAAARALIFSGTAGGGGGMVRGTGAQNAIVSSGVAESHVSQALTLQGAALIVESGTLLIEADLYANDFTGTAVGVVSALYWGIIMWFSGALVGSGNTSFLFVASWMSQISFSTNPIAVAGSSPSATPIRASGSPDFSVANLANGAGALNRGGNGVYYTNLVADAPFAAVTGYAAPGAVAVVINNAPAGSPAAPIRYAQIPDGAGGLLTIPSLT